MRRLNCGPEGSKPATTKGAHTHHYKHSYLYENPNTTSPSTIQPPFSITDNSASLNKACITDTVCTYTPSASVGCLLHTDPFRTQEIKYLILYTRCETFRYCTPCGHSSVLVTLRDVTTRRSYSHQYLGVEMLEHKHFGQRQSVEPKHRQEENSSSTSRAPAATRFLKHFHISSNAGISWFTELHMYQKRKRASKVIVVEPYIIVAFPLP